MIKDNIQLVIPMSGKGQRFKTAGYTDPKPLIEVDGEPMIHWVTKLFPGVKDVIFICSMEHLEDTDMRNILMGICPTAKIVEVDSHGRGPVHAVAKAFNRISNTKEVIVSYCDYGTLWDFEKFMEDVKGFDGGLACYKGFHPHMLGTTNYAFCKHTDNVLEEIKEKEPFTDNRMEEYASNGTYYFNNGSMMKKYFQEAIDTNLNVNGEHYVSLVYNLLVRDGLKTKIFEIDKMLQWGIPYDLEVYKMWSSYFNRPWSARSAEHFKLVLPMSGKGARFSEEGYEVPKPFIDVDGSPMVFNAVDCLPKHKEAVFICLEEHDAEDIIKDKYPSAKVVNIDGVTEGQAVTCEIGIREANIDPEEPILISACDNGVAYDSAKFSELIKDESNDVIVWSFRNNPTSQYNPDMYSWLSVDEEDIVNYVSCKKFNQLEPKTTHAIIGTMYFRKAKYFLDGLKTNMENDYRTNGEFYVDDVLNRNIESGLNVKVFEVDNYICWGTPNDYKTYNYWSEFFG